MESYEHLEMEVICFDREDIIITSNPLANYLDNDPNSGLGVWEPVNNP